MKIPAAIVSICLLAGLQGAASAAAGDDRYVHRGQLVPAGATRLNLYCMGTGTPAVVFDSGWEDWAPVWTLVQPAVARFTRACSYDRAGAGYSDAGPMPRTSARIADELHSALRNAGIKGPYVLVGDAFGGDNVRTFAIRHMEDTAGLVLVEADAGGPGEHQGDGRIVAQLRECRDAIAAGRPLPPERPGQPARTCAQQFFRGLPEAAWSPELNARLLEIAQTKITMYDAFISEMEQMPADEAYLAQHIRSFGARPIRVLTTGNHGVHALDPARPKDAQQQAYQDKVARLQARWLEGSSNAMQLFTDKSSEYIPFDQPDFVVDAIRDVYLQSRDAPDQMAAAMAMRAPGTVFRDCTQCPEMVVVPAGTFTMGSSAEEKKWAAIHGATAGSVADEAPQHTVSIRSFALGRHDVTRAEYAEFVRQTQHPAGDACFETGNPDSPRHAGATWQNPGFSQSDRDPVVCVDWNDARAYVTWLNDKARRHASSPADGPYRLPSESEWEYAARAGTKTYFWWGDDVEGANSHAWFKDNAAAQTHPVAAMPANPFGLYDMSGNVWQWTADCYAEDYAKAPADGSAAVSMDSCLRSDRGGSWFYPAWLLRPATRERNPADYRDGVMGFRVARTLP